MLGVNSEQKESMQHYIPDSIYGLTLAWVTSENPTKQLECRLILTRSSFTGPYLLCYCPESTAPVRGSTSTACQLLSPTNSLLASRYLFRSRRDFKSKNPLSGFAPKQTKESSAWRATYIVLQIHQLWQLGFSKVYSDSCCSCSFEPEIIKIDQSSHTMYSNNIVNFQGSTTILNACTKKVWQLVECTTYNENNFFFLASSVWLSSTFCPT